MAGPAVLASVLGGSALLGGIGGYKAGKTTKKRYRRYRNMAFQHYDQLFADIDRLYGTGGDYFRQAQQEKGAALGLLRGMEEAQLGEAGKIFGGERRRAQDYLTQLMSANQQAMAGAGLYGSTVQAGLQRQAASEGSRLQQDISGREAGLRTGIIGASRGAQAQIEGAMPLAQILGQHAGARVGAQQSKIGFLTSLMGGGPSTTAATMNSAMQGLGIGLGGLGLAGAFGGGGQATFGQGVGAGSDYQKWVQQQQYVTPRF